MSEIPKPAGQNEPAYQLRHGADDWVAEPQNHLSFKSLLNSIEFDGAISVTKVAIEGKHLELITKSNVRIYILISGHLSFSIEDQSGIELQPGVILTLAAGTKYSLEGKGEYFVINAPAFKESDDEYI